MSLEEIFDFLQKCSIKKNMVLVKNIVDLEVCCFILHIHSWEARTSHSLEDELRGLRG